MNVTEAEYARILRRQGKPEPRRTAALPCPSEEEEQADLMVWVAAMQGQCPDLALLYHVPNGGLRAKATGVMLKRTGLKKGVLDLHLPVARGGYIGLWLEIKKADHSNEPTPEQEWWIEQLRRKGHRCEVCYGKNEAVAVLQDYLAI